MRLRALFFLILLHLLWTPRLSADDGKKCLLGEQLENILSQEVSIVEDVGIAEARQPHTQGHIRRTASGYRLIYEPRHVPTGKRPNLRGLARANPEDRSKDLLFNVMAWKPGDRHPTEMHSRALMDGPLEGFEYEAPKEMFSELPIKELQGRKTQQFTLLTIEGTPEARLHDFFDKAGRDPNLEPTYLTAGGYQTVFALHGPMPDEVKDLKPTLQAGWIENAATRIAKVRFVRKEADQRSTALVFLRDLATDPLAKQLLEKPKFKGRQLIEVVADTQSLAAVQHAIRTDPFLTANKNVPTQSLAYAVDVLLAPDFYFTKLPKPERVRALRNAKIEAIGILKKAGFVDSSGRVTSDSAKDALAHLNALERSFVVTNSDAIEFQLAHGLPLYTNKLSNGAEGGFSMGFDFAHAGNCSWNAEKKMFQVFDK